MCDPVSMVVGAVGGMVASKVLSKPKSASYGDPEAERMKAEAEATASANAKLRQTQLRRREQQSLIARGAAPSLGDENTTGDSPISSGRRMLGGFGSEFRTTPDVLMARGSASPTTVPGMTPGGSRKRISPPARAY